MKGDTDTIKKFIQILINLQGAEEATEASKTFYDTQSKGVQGAKKDAEDAAPKIEDFLKRWKYELMLVGGAVAGIYAMVRYSTVAHTMMDLLGRSIGFVADVILVRLLPYVMALVGWIIDLGRAINDLPDGFKDMIAFAIVGATALWGLHKALIAAGIAGGTLGLVLGALAGLVIGIEVVLFLREMGFFKALGDTIGNAKAAFLNWLDDLSLSWNNFWIDRMNFFIEIWNNTFGRLPGQTQFEKMRQMDRYDQWQMELEEHIRTMGGGVGGRTAEGDTRGDTEGWGAVIAEMRSLGMTPKEYTDYRRRLGMEPPRYEFIPPHKGWNEEGNAIKDFLSWGYDYKNEWQGKRSSVLPSTSAFDFEAYYKEAYPGAPDLSSMTSTKEGTSPITSKTQSPQVVIQHAEIHISQDDPQSRPFIDQIAENVNRKNALGVKRVNPYG